MSQRKIQRRPPPVDAANPSFSVRKKAIMSSAPASEKAGRWPVRRPKGALTFTLLQYLAGRSSYLRTPPYWSVP